ncbi:hypothetical protein GTQ99_19235 [Kineococcus sp. T13]|uniref:SRPBCC family protein n=1 Tax=Kineococcus vitellinus TaxID=2696565 RepID=UPI0014137596|nr:SRPBCC family protein [Kineococcus vitellinus]NAZ77530.1 hypothetical protein [Kineococcus vitellinus]
MSIDFTARAELTGDVRHVFAVLTDWPRQSPWVPATVVERLPGPVGGPGERFAAVSRLGPWRLDDRMEVLSWQAPADAGGTGRVHVVKTGPVLGGSVRILVAAAGGGRVRVEWSEQVVVHPRALAVLAALGSPVAALGGRLGFEAVLRRGRRELEGGR